MRYLYKFLMLIDVIGTVDTLLAPEFNKWRFEAYLLGFALMLTLLILHDTRVELKMAKFMNDVSRTLITKATHEEIDELRRQLKFGLTNNAAKYTRELFEKYEKKDG